MHCSRLVSARRLELHRTGRLPIGRRMPSCPKINYSLKEVVSSLAVIIASLQTTFLESGGLIPQGHGSFRPSLSNNSLSPCTTRRPRLTCDADGNPLRRLLLRSKGGLVGVEVVLHGVPPEGTQAG